MNVVHLTGSPFFGGPERQMLGLALALPGEWRTAFLSFSEGGRCRPFLDRVREAGFEGVELTHNFPRCRAAVQELASELRRLRADVLCCAGYKSDLLGWLAARRVGIPVVAVSHGWTAATLRVRAYEVLDRAILHFMDAVVCVSEGQAVKVRRAGVARQRVHVIRNAIRMEDFSDADPAYREQLQALFPTPRRLILGAAGRLSPEKGFSVLVNAAEEVLRERPDAGFILFGDGPLRDELARQVTEKRLQDRFILAGFRNDLDRVLPALDLMILPSFTEGLPVVVLEALAAGVPVVATAVGGTPEVLDTGVSGFLVPPGDPGALAWGILQATACDTTRQEMGRRGRQRVQAEFTFAVQARQYLQLFEKLGIGRNITPRRQEPTFLPLRTANMHGPVAPV